MVLIRYGNEEVTKTFSNRKKGKVLLIYQEDTVWSLPQESHARSEQLKDAGYFSMITEKRYTNAPDEYTVWRSHTKRKGTRFGKIWEQRASKKEVSETKPKFKQSTNYTALKKKLTK